MPLAEAPSSDRAPPPRLHVLCAEDHDQVADLLRLVLTRSGHEVDCAADGAEAWQKMAARDFRYDVLITDHVMPEMNGLELVRALWSRAYPGAVIVQSARLTAQDRADYEAAGVSRFIEKPVRPDALRALLVGVKPLARKG